MYDHRKTAVCPDGISLTPKSGQAKAEAIYPVNCIKENIYGFYVQFLIPPLPLRNALKI